MADNMIEFIKELRVLAPRIPLVVCGNWARLAKALGKSGVALTPEQARDWDLLGYLPEECGQMILDGITAEQTREMEQYAADLAGGEKALAAQRLAQMIADGTIIVTPRGEL